MTMINGLVKRIAAWIKRMIRTISTPKKAGGVDCTRVQPPVEVDEPPVVCEGYLPLSIQCALMVRDAGMDIESVKKLMEGGHGG
jgi:hypothetical protein